MPPKPLICGPLVRCLFLLLAWCPLTPSGVGQNAAPVASPVEIVRWTNGPFAHPDYFPIAVWVQNPRNAVKFYFVHQFKPVFKEAALLDDPEMLAAVTAINREIRELAVVLNSPTTNSAVVKSSVPDVPIASMLKHRGETHWLFTVNMRNQPTKGTFTIPDIVGSRPVEVLGESRRLESKGGQFTDEFKSYDVHLYRLD